ncbi:MAG: putative lipopolysaccharide heptosyltransferase III [Chlamydiales bacterium]
MSEQIGKILVSKLRHHGDVLLSTPVFSILRSQFPLAYIDVHIYRDSFPVLDGNTCIRKYWLVDRDWKKMSIIQRYRNEIQLLKNIRAEKYDLTINLTEGDRGAVVAFVSKARIRIGYDSEGSGMWRKNRCYTHLARICHRPRHAVEKNLDVLRCLGIFPEEKQKNLEFFIPQKFTDNILLQLREKNWHSYPFIIVHPVSRWSFKCLPVATISNMIKKLLSIGHHVILTSSSREEELIMNRDILSNLPISNSIWDLSGKLSMKEFAALLKFASLLITIDSFPLHLASALQTPVVAAFGPTSDITWSPWKHSQSQIVIADTPCRPCYMAGCGGSRRSACLEQISVDALMKAIHKVKSLPK